MPKISVITKDSELVGEIDLNEWNLDKSIARATLLAELVELIETATEMEKENQDG